MGEQKQRSRKKEAILAQENRCVYCSNTKSDGMMFTLEHMPPKGIFRDKNRLSGLEFACCDPCNQLTKGADNVAAMMSFITAKPSGNDWGIPALQRIMAAVRTNAPGVIEEIRGGSFERIWRYTSAGILVEQIRTNAEGPLLRAYLSAFSAKLGMAFYREHVGQPLPETGAVFSQFYCNSGLEKPVAETMLGLMPVYGNLRMGKRNSEGEFDYRYNTDDRTIVASLAGFHDNFFVLTFATSEPDRYAQIPMLGKMTRTTPGQIVRLIPSA